MRFNRVRECRFGTMLYNINDQYVGRSLDIYGEFSFAESEFFRQVVRPGDVVVEVGANIGAHTLHLAHLVGPSGAVHAFEPQRIAFQALCANMALNSITQAYCHPLAVGREPGFVVVPRLDPHRGHNFGGVAMRREGPGERAPLVTLDSLDLPRCRLIKVDVEGMEEEVIAGAGGTIRRHHPYLYVEDDRPAKSESLIRCLDGLDYDLYRHRPPLFNPANFLENPENVFENLVSTNLIGVPRGRPVVIRGYQRVSPSTGPVDG